VEIEINGYKSNDKIKIVAPDETWTKHHFSKSEYNMRIANVNPFRMVQTGTTRKIYNELFD
jgi:hypothetical protein